MDSSSILDYFSDDHEANVLKWERLCNHPKKSYPLTAFDLKLAYCFILCNCAEQSSQRRHRIFNNLRRLLLRMRNSAAHFAKAADDPTSVDTLKNYKCFLNDLKSVAFHYLSQTTANFNRRISALSIVKALYCDVPLTDNNFDLRVHFRMFEWLKSGDIESLVSCLDDSFQLCQQAAFDVLVTSKLTDEQFDFLAFFADTKKRLLDVGDAVIVPSNFRLRLVCTKLPAEIPRILRDILSMCQEILAESDVFTGAESLVTVIERLPYVLLTAVEDVLIVNFRHRQADINSLLEEIDKICHRFSTIVSPVCHDLSPEGYLPSEFLALLIGSNVNVEVAARLQTNFAQRLLVCCWRTHKCVSAILGLIAAEATYPEEIDASVLRRTGDYLWLQLTKCRHRGAFECAAQAFRDVCTRLWTLHRSAAGMTIDPELVTPVLWLHWVIDALRGGKDVGSLCSTRRSAGLPHLVSVILVTAKVKRNFPHLGDTLDFLLDCRRLEPRLEVHCVNVLKTLFTHTQLADGVGAYTEPALRVCYDGYRSAHWAVRNAHSQFFAALVRRIFSIPRSAERTLHVATCNKLTSHNFFERHPSIYVIMLAHINSVTADRPDIATFPFLTLLTHLQCSAATLESQFPLAPFVPGVFEIMLSSPLHQIRELAAVALTTIAMNVQLTMILQAVLRQLDEMKESLSQNEFDGLLNMLNAMAQQSLFAEGQESLAIAERILDRLLPSLLKCENDFTLSAALTLIWEIGSIALKRDALSRVLASGWQPTDGDCFHLVNWRSAVRPIGGLVAELSEPSYWLQISHAAAASSILGVHASDVGTALAKIRWEAYRAFLKSDLPISSEAKMAVYADLICDLHQYDEEHRLKIVIALLARERDHIVKLKTTVSLEDIDRYDEICESRHETCLNLLRLRFVSCSPIVGEMVGKADELLFTTLTKSDNERSRLAALKFVDDHLGKEMERLLETACLALKDESPMIRRYASKVLLPWLVPLMPEASLKAEICWSFALDRFPGLPSRLADVADASDAPSDLFGASTDNTFAEAFGIFEFNRVKELLEVENL